MILKVLVCVAVLILTEVSGHDDDTYAAAIETAVDDKTVDDGTDAIFKFLGFKCPKGHRCLPVLECLPCDYGTYKANEGSDLCENCPSGCTTLRKGAESKKECVPKCPPGFEESECGKTCTKCRAGYYKNNWKNKQCKACPNSSHWDKNMVGLKKKSQCYQTVEPECHEFTGDVIFALDASGALSEDGFADLLQTLSDFVEAFDVTEEDDATRFSVFTYSDRIGDVIRSDEYSDKTELQMAINGLRWLNGNVSDISKALDFITNNMTYGAGNRYDVKDIAIVVANGQSPSSYMTSSSAEFLHIAVDKVFAVGVGHANENEIYSIATHDDYTVIAENVEELAKRLPDLTKDACDLFKSEPDDEVVTPRPATTVASDDRCYLHHGSCSKEDYDNLRLIGLENTNCQYFCQCAHVSTAEDGAVAYYWEEHICAPGTLFDDSIKVCVHEWQVTCTDTGPSTTPEPAVTTEKQTADGGSGYCLINDPCSIHDYEVRRLIPLPGSGCKQFCHCAHAEGSVGSDVTYYWEEQTCADGTLFDESLPSPVCNHEASVNCDDNGTYITPDPDTAGTTEVWDMPDDDTDRCYQKHGICSEEEYDDLRLIGLKNTNCQYFCQCAHASTSEDGDVAYYWEEHICAPGTLFDDSIKVCVHEWQVTCTDTGPSTTPDPALTTEMMQTPAGGYRGCVINDACSIHDYEVRRLIPLSGSGCKQFCHCAHAEGSAGSDVTYYWEEQTCADGTLFDESLPTPVCNHEESVTCDDNGTYTAPDPVTDVTTEMWDTPDDETDRCYQKHGICSEEEYEDLRLIGLENTNCQYFCQCAHASTAEDGAVAYYWEEHICAPGTLFDDSIKVCVHEWQVTCTDTGPSTTPEPALTTEMMQTPAGGYGGCVINDECFIHDYEVRRLKPLSGSGCKQFCHCAHAEGSAGSDVSYYWEEQTCADGTLFDESLPSPVCNHEEYVKCDNGTVHASSEPTSESPALSSSVPSDPVNTDRCYIMQGKCNADDHDIKRLIALEGVDCQIYCHCATASTELDGTVTYYWEEKACPSGTIFVDDLGVCGHSNQYTCSDALTSPLP